MPTKRRTVPIGNSAGIVIPTRWLRASRRIAAIGAVAVAALLVSACATPSRPAPPIFELFGAPQQTYDRLPNASTATTLLIPGTTRLIGTAGIYRFYAGLSVGLPAGPYCVLVADVYGRDVVKQCGGENFGGEYAEGLQYTFGATAAGPVPHARAMQSTSAHLNVQTMLDGWDIGFPEKGFTGVEQQEHDVLPFGGEHWHWVVPGSSRLLAGHGEHRYYVALVDWPGSPLCIVEIALDEHSARAACGAEDAVLWADGVGPSVHFAAHPFTDEAPDGWLQVTPHMRVRDASGGD